MIRIVIQLIRGLELLPDRGTAVLQECIDWILILPVDLEVILTMTINQHPEHTLTINNCTYIGLCKHLKVRNKVVPRSHVFQNSEDLAGVSSRLLQQNIQMLFR